MLFLRDMSIPNKECGRKLVTAMASCGIFSDQTVIVNLEGVLHQNRPKDIFGKFITIEAQ